MTSSWSRREKAGAKEVGKINLVLGEMTGVVEQVRPVLLRFPEQGDGGGGGDAFFQGNPDHSPLPQLR